MIAADEIRLLLAELRAPVDPKAFGLETSYLIYCEARNEIAEKIEALLGAEPGGSAPLLPAGVQVDYTCLCSTFFCEGTFKLGICDVHRDGRAFRLRYVEAQKTAEPDPPSQPKTSAIETAIEQGLDWLKRESFTVDYTTIPRGAGGIGVVVEYNTALHALLFVRQALRHAEPDGPAPPLLDLITLVEDFNGWWHLNREGSVNATYAHIDAFTKQARALIERSDRLAAPAPEPPR